MPRLAMSAFASRLRRLAAGLLLAGSAQAAPPALGLLIPVGPPDYAPILSQITGDRIEQSGPFAYHVGKIAGVDVVVGIAPYDGPLVRSLSAQDMIEHFNIKALIYPGTSGAGIAPDRMRVGDVVLGAANVDFGNFYMAKDGTIVGNEFGHEKTGRHAIGTLYTDPQLLHWLACSARRVTAVTSLPAWLNRPAPRARPAVFYYGIQGTSTMWISNLDLIRRIYQVFHVIDADGDWYSDAAATLHHVPFIEVSTISNSILEYPRTDRGIPLPPPGADKASIIAQRLSDQIAIDLIAHAGKAILAGSFTNPSSDPFPSQDFDHPKQPGDLLKNCS